MNRYPTLNIYTHAASFHADEVFACTLIDFFLKMEANKKELIFTRVIRSNEVPVIPEGEQAIVLDIGRRFEPNQTGVAWLDHHQNIDIPCAAVLARDWLCVRYPDLVGIIMDTCEPWIEGVDKHDRGMATLTPGQMSLSQAVASYLPDDTTNNENTDCCFYNASKLAFNVILSSYKAALEKSRVLKILTAAEQLNNPVICFTEHLRSAAKILSSEVNKTVYFFIYPHARGGYALQAVNIPGTMTPRIKISPNVKLCSFRHESGFLASFQSTSDATHAALLSLKEHNERTH